MAALEKELPLVDAGDPASTERCRTGLQSLLQLAFTEPMQLSRIRSVVKKLRNHSKLGKLANQVLIYSFLDRETRQWWQALDHSDLSKVEAKVAFFYLHVEKKQCLSAELKDRFSLWSLVDDTEALLENEGHERRQLSRKARALDDRKGVRV